VNGKTYSLHEDQPESIAEQMASDPTNTRVIYDPQKPSRAITLNPEIAHLPPE
jgi:hypothetical protein